MRGNSAAAALFVGLLFSPCTRAQEENVEKVRFETVDGVQLRGVYYPAKRQAPCVLLLHALGHGSQQKVWRELATTLQKKGYAVLGFDFRGHGDSCSVEAEEFWSPKYPNNRALVRGFPRDEIDFKDFDYRYYPVLVNDIAAAKAFLDRRNDLGHCNSSNLIVIGADTGATLGALWVNAEWNRFRLVAPQPGFPPQPEKQPEGKYILGCVWLDISSTLGRRRVNVPALVDLAGHHGETPMVFLYGQGDAQGERLAKSCERSLKRGKKLEYTTSVQVPAAKETSGRDLLQQGLGTQKAIVEYLDTLAEEEGNEWAEHDFRGSRFVWRPARAGFSLIPANAPRSKLLNYHSYEQYLP
jgi:hypothetical protein